MILRSFILTTGLLIFWQLIIIVFQLPGYILPTPFAVLKQATDQIGLLLDNSVITAVEIMLGLFCGITVGIISALGIAISRMLKFWLLPIVIMSQAIPIFAIAPLLVLWLGYGMASKIVTIVLMLFFPVASAFYDGLKATPSHWLDTAKTMSGSKWRTLWFIRVPFALPNLASGIRLAATIAPIGAIISEWIGASQGLGYLMINAGARVEIPLMFASLAIVMLLALILYLAIDALLKRILFW